MLKKILFLSILFFLIFNLVNFSLAKECEKDEDCKKGIEKCVAGECVRKLEVIYPQIPGVAVPETIVDGLPDYVKYIFLLAIFLSAFIIFGVLIYGGILYLTSFGRPVQLSEARSRILAGFLGSLILLAAYLLFNTINPQLVAFKMPEVEVLEPVIEPGFYLCNYSVDSNEIKKLVEDYIKGPLGVKKKAAKKIKKIIKPPELNPIKKALQKEKKCEWIRSSTNLDFVFQPGGIEKHTIFVIPGKNPETGKWEYNFGLIFHEKENFQGRCFIYPPPQPMGGENYQVYFSFAPADFDPSPAIGFAKVRSVTKFQRPIQPPIENLPAVTLYQCLDYNEGKICPKELRGQEPQELSFSIVEADLQKISQDKLGILAARFDDPASGTRSIKIHQRHYNFALLFEGENFNENSQICERFIFNDPYLLNQPIGQCGTLCSRIGCQLPGAGENCVNRCYPCLKSMIIIKGLVL